MEFYVGMKIQDGQQVGFENKIQEVLRVNHGEIWWAASSPVDNCTYHCHTSPYLFKWRNLL